MFVYKILVNPIHTILKYGDCYQFMTLRIGNGEVLKSSSQWQLKEFWKLNNSSHDLDLEQSILMSAYPYLRHPLQFVR